MIFFFSQTHEEIYKTKNRSNNYYNHTGNCHQFFTAIPYLIFYEIPIENYRQYKSHDGIDSATN